MKWREINAYAESVVFDYRMQYGDDKKNSDNWRHDDAEGSSSNADNKSDSFPRTNQK